MAKNRYVLVTILLLIITMCPSYAITQSDELRYLKVIKDKTDISADEQYHLEIGIGDTYSNLEVEFNGTLQVDGSWLGWDWLPGDMTVTDNMMNSGISVYAEWADKIYTNVIVNKETDGAYTGGNWIRDVDQSGTVLLMKNLMGAQNYTNNSGSITDAERLQEYFTVLMLNTYINEHKGKSVFEQQAYLNELIDAMYMNTYLSDDSLKYFGDIVGVPDLEKELDWKDSIIKALQAEVDVNRGIVMSNFKELTIAKTYITPYLENTTEFSEASLYEQYVMILYSLAEDINNEDVDLEIIGKTTGLPFLVTDEHTKTFLKGTTLEIGLLNKVLTTAFNDNTLTEPQKLGLYAVVNQRGSQYAMQVVIPSEYDFAHKTKTGGAIADSVRETYLQFESVLSTLNGNATESYLQNFTLNSRIRYHYYGMQDSGADKTNEAVRLSFANSTEIHFGYWEPSVLRQSEEFEVVNPMQYTAFINALNEIPQLIKVIQADVTILGTETNILNTTKEELTKVDSLLYLRQMKDAVSFLSIRDTSSTFSDIISKWYTPVDINGQMVSMEDIYNHMQDLGFIMDKLQEEITVEGDYPFEYMFSLQDGVLQPMLRIGIAQSATFVPLETNVYEAHAYRIIENDNFFNFHYQWGYYRKALKIATEDKAAVTLSATGTNKGLKVATLSDILSADRDIVLYADDSFYNYSMLDKELQKAYEMVYYPEKVDSELEATVKDKVNERSEEAKHVWNVAVNLWKGNAKDVIIGEVQRRIYTEVTQYTDAIGDYLEGFEDPVDEAFFGKNLIEQYTEQYTGTEGEHSRYSPFQSMAVVSGVYRYEGLANMLNSSGNQPVFISSKDTPVMVNATVKDKSAIFNYALLQNIKNQLSISYTSKLDLSSPVYLDIYGNILTESGLVVVPAASNATLQKDYSIYTAGFIQYYGKEYSIPKEYASILNKYSSALVLDEDEGVFKFSNKETNSKLNLQRLSTRSDSVMEALLNYYSIQFVNNDFDMERYLGSVWYNVLRGAPLEHIDKNEENLNTLGNFFANGLVQAYKLDQLRDRLGANKQNTILGLPNIAFAQETEIAVALAFRVALLIVALAVIVQITIMTLEHNINIFTLAKIIGTVVLVIGMVMVIPNVFESSYYLSNKALLQNEALDIMMLNYEKELLGAEISINSVESPDTSTELYLHVEDIEVNYFGVFEEIMLNDFDTTLNSIYEEASSKSFIAGMKPFMQIEDAMFVSVNDLLRSSKIATDPRFSTLFQYMSEDSPVSYYSPYYVFVDSILSEVNKYNIDNDIFTYKTDFYTGGEPKSLGLVEQYFTSDKFLSGETDPLSLEVIYKLQALEYSNSSFSADEIETMRRSYWSKAGTVLEASDIQFRLNLLNEKLRDFILDNRDVIGKVSDETFVKTLALKMAMEHNKLFSIQTMQYLDIKNISSEDVGRLAIATKEIMLKNSSLSFSRYVYELGGEFGVYLAAFYTMLTFVVGYLKPAVTLLVFVFVFASIYVYKLLLNNKTKSLAGYFKLMGLVVVFNVLYALALKLTFYLPVLVPSAVCLLVQVLFQIIFIAMYVWLVTALFSDWKNMGDAPIENAYVNTKDLILSVTSLERRMENIETKTKTNSGWDILESMNSDDELRL